MEEQISLNGAWQLTYAEGSPLSRPDQYTMERPACYRRQLAAAVPEPVHQTLFRHGLLPDWNVALNSLSARWVEESIWIYRRELEIPAAALGEGKAVWLRFDRLECVAEVRINGREVGKSRTALIPVEFEISKHLRPGSNQLTVQLESGTVACADLPAKEYGIGPLGENSKRNWLRKPQYQSGWDWSARLQNIGILGDVTLTFATAAVWREIGLAAVVNDDCSAARIQWRVTLNRQAGQPETATLRLRIAATDIAVTETVTMPEGDSVWQLDATLPQPKLWWPRGQGEPYLYEVELELESGGVKRQCRKKTGMRKVAVDQTPHPEGGQHFILQINNRPVFCKGGNWVPADLLYSTVDAARYRELAELACEANFNTLRIWGGGLYMTEEFAAICDELGLLVWHDFIFACAKYPGHDADFRRQVEREAESAVRALAAHPSLVVWCGNNELEWAALEWGCCNGREDWLDHALFHHYLPKVVGREAPHVFYWPSSPYSPGFLPPNDPSTGDQHPWQVSLQVPGGSDWFAYRDRIDRFPNEGGVLGASSLATLYRFLPEAERQLFSLSWDHHDNPFAMMDCDFSQPGHAYETIALWLDRKAETLSLEEYAILSGILQADGLTEYIANYRRRMFSSAAAIFWMYNDSWPVSNGWTIVDYDLHRKLSYHPVRRAFAPVTVVVATVGDQVVVFGVNDAPEAWHGEVHYGFFATAGGVTAEYRKTVTLPANASTRLAELPLAEWEAAGKTRTAAFARLNDARGLAAQYRLLLARFAELEWGKPEIRVSRRGDAAVFESDCFAWGVCVDITGEGTAADNCFDLFPGMPYELPWAAGAPLPQVKFCAGNWLAEQH